jgi:DNA modification methylase
VTAIYHGDCFDVLASLPECSVDACVTDPPYGIGFMGREWDTFKPGAEAARIVPNRAIDSDNPNLRGRTRGPASSQSAVEYDYTVKGLREFQGWTEQWARQVFRVLKPGAYLVVCGAPRSYHRMACGLEEAGFVIRDKFSWLFGSGFPKNLNLGDGKGTALKPAHEPIALAWKPFKGSITACHEMHGTAALNIDACRIGGADGHGGGRKMSSSGQTLGAFGGYEQDGFAASSLGRWPANVLLDEHAAAALDEQTEDLHGAGAARDGSAAVVSENYDATSYEMPPNRNMRRLGDRGGASRFYYVAKPSRRERELGCDHLIARQRDESRKAGNPGGDNPRNRGLQPRGNFHPTVKPVALMRWLVRLVTPPGGTVMDPFTGSGTTGMACALERVAFIGIEREADYVEIIKARIAAAQVMADEEAAQPVQAAMFDDTDAA